MSPEQLRGEEIDRRSDLFALGISLYMMTTGRHPFKGDNEAVTIGNIVSDDPVQPPHQLIQEYPKALESVVLRALDKDRRRRFATANDMLRALSMALPSRVPIGTEEEVASFLRSLLPDRLLQRKAIIKEALDAADQRISPEQPPRRLRSPFGADFSPPSLPGIYQMEGATLTGNAGTATLETVPEPPLSAKRRGRRMMIAGASLGVVGVATIVAMMLLPRASVDANNEAVVTAAPQMAQPAPRHEEPEPVVAVPVEQLAVVGAGDAGAPDAPAPRSRAKTRSSKPRNVSEPEKKSESGSTPFVSPVRSPGF
jgi:serine/threonine-protein kinase